MASNDPVNSWSGVLDYPRKITNILRILFLPFFLSGYVVCRHQTGCMKQPPQRRNAPRENAVKSGENTPTLTAGGESTGGPLG